jgi:hypothetical protein
MSDATREGPILGSALFASANRRSTDVPHERRKSPTWDSANAPSAVRHRRQIGVGARAIIVTNPAHAASRRAVQRPLNRGTKMKRTTMYISLAGALMFSAAAFGISSAMDSPRTLMSRADYTVAKKAIESETRVSLGRCRDVDGVARDVCKAEVRAEERIKKADLDARYHGTVAAAADARLARAKAQYDVAKAKCSNYGSEQKIDCLQSARAEKARALADAKLASL